MLWVTKVTETKSTQLWPLESDGVSFMCDEERLRPESGSSLSAPMSRETEKTALSSGLSLCAAT